MNKNCKWIAIIVLFLITLFHTCSLKFSIPFTPFLILNNINLDISLYIDVIECIKKYVINFIVNVMSLLTTQIPMIIAFIILKINQSKKYNNYFINFLIIALLLNYQPPPPPSSSSYNNEKYHFNSTNNLDSKYDFLSSFEETSALWLNKLKIYNPLSYISFLNFPLVHAENINDNNNESITDANIVYNSTSSEDIWLSIQSKCLESNRIFLSEQEEIEFEMILSHPPSANINITFVNEQPNIFKVEPENILYKNAYYSVKTKNETIISLLESNYNLTRYFTLKTFKDNGNSKLKFIVDTDLKIVYEDDKHKVEEEKNSNRLIIDNSLSQPLEMKATSNDIGTINIFLILWIVLFMFSIGLSLSGNTIKGLYKWKRLKPFICGYVCQLIINPLVAFILTKIFKLSEFISLGVIIVAASPGSFIAPVFTYYLGGDRALAVGLCLIATIFGSFTFPFTIWIFCIVSNIKIETFIPFWETFSLTATQIVPLGMGCLILHFKPNWASKLRKGCPIWAVAIILTSLITSIKNYGQIFINSWQVYSMPIILGIISYIVGFVVPRILGLNNQQVRAICFNTGLQNSPLALTVIQVLGMPSCNQLISLVPLHHSFWTVVEGVIIAILMFFVFRADVKPLIENSEYQIAVGKTEEEKKAMLQDEFNDNSFNNLSTGDTSAMDISDINLHQHLVVNSNTNLLNSSSEILHHHQHGNNSSNGYKKGPRSLNLYRSGSGSMTSHSTHSTILPSSLKDIYHHHSNDPNENNNHNKSIYSSNKNNDERKNSFININNLSPASISTSLYQIKNGSSSTIKFNGRSSPYRPKTPSTQASSINKHSDIGLEIFDIPLGGDDEIDFTKKGNSSSIGDDSRYSPADSIIPAIVIQSNSSNNSRASSAIVTFSPRLKPTYTPQSPRSPRSPASVSGVLVTPSPLTLPSSYRETSGVHSRENTNETRNSPRKKYRNNGIPSIPEGQKLQIITNSSPTDDDQSHDIDNANGVEMPNSLEDNVDNDGHPAKDDKEKEEKEEEDVDISFNKEGENSRRKHQRSPTKLSEIMNKYLPSVFKKPLLSDIPSNSNSTLDILSVNDNDDSQEDIQSDKGADHDHLKDDDDADDDGNSKNNYCKDGNHDNSGDDKTLDEQFNSKDYTKRYSLLSHTDTLKRNSTLFESRESSKISLDTLNFHLKHQSSSQGLTPPPYKVSRTDTVQTFETANSASFNPEDWSNEGGGEYLNLKLKDVESVSSEEDDYYDDSGREDIFEECALDFSNKGKDLSHLTGV